jgi:RNA polymerase sigma-70 factor (sigma-E family)
MALETVPAIDVGRCAGELAGVREPFRFELLVTEGSGSQSEDEELADRTDRSDQRTWNNRDECVARLFDEHYRGLCRLAALLLNDSAAAEEVVQEAFLRTFSSWWRVRHPERAQWYLRTSVVNLCRSKLRRRSTEERGNRVTWSDEDRQSGTDATDLSDDAVTLVKFVRQLPPRQRDAVVLRYYEDLPEAEIARILGCAVGTIKSQLSKARATIAAAMEDESGDGSSRQGGKVGRPQVEPREGGSGA